ncbi:MAG TPA: FG-GAP-like repeat-containing protein [Blastocatellia bacterium]|nr:FG-GAP-like repeat-containing protein [Blastocatellia bacterium]
MKRSIGMTLVAFMFMIGLLGYPNARTTVAGGAGTRLTPSALTPMRGQGGLGPSLVSVNGRQLIVRKRNGDGTLSAPSPYTIRGTDWSPASTDTISAVDDPIHGRRIQFGIWAARDIPMIKNMNANTVFTYMDPGLDSTGMNVLDQLYNNGLMIVMTVFDGGTDTTRTMQAVNFFKNHPAILAWNLGIEWNINPPISVPGMAQRMHDAADLVKGLDSNHPVMTSYGDIDINAPDLRLSDTKSYVNGTCANVDVWALNIFRNSDFGTLFDQWKAITGKPMLLGEFGTDAVLTYNQNHPPNGSVVETMQSQWERAEWNHLAKNLSANHPGKVAIGGFLFEWNDEWWKVTPPGQQDLNGGDGTVCGGHPDNFCNEEYFGIVALDQMNTTRVPRATYNTMTTAFAAGYQPPVNPAQIFRATSAGFAVPNTGQGFGRFYKGNVLAYDRESVAGRGFNVAVVDPCTGDLTAQTYDTWERSTQQAVMTALTNFLNNLPNGVLVMLAVGDDAGLTAFDSCTHLTASWVGDLYSALHSLGAVQIDAYCYRDSWAMTVIKGNPASKNESLHSNAMTPAETSALFTLPILSAISPSSRQFCASPGTGTISVSVPTGCNWIATVDPSTAFVSINTGGSGTGNGIVTYSVASNNSGAVRTGTITIAGQLFTIVQSEAGGSSGRTSFNFDGDAKTDQSVWRPSTGVWLIKNSSNGSTTSVGWGINGDKLAPGDYDGDGKTDTAIWRPSTGAWFIINSSDGSTKTVGWGVNTDVPAPADYDGDGKTDTAVWRPSNGSWFIINSSNGSVTIVGWGVNGDVPVAGDYDGDGKSDVAVWRPSTGVWFIIKSSNGSTMIQGWGVPGDKAVPGDYDGDGKTDIAIWRPSTGVWFIINSVDGSPRVQGWGISGDVPVPGDYDGDGRTDVAVWRPSSGTWFIINSSNGSTSMVAWGINGDTPVPSAFVQ